MIDTIFWDNDGILVETEGLYYQATQEIMQSAGHSLTPEEYIEFFLIQNAGAWHLLDIDEKTIAELRRQRNDRYSELLGEGVAVIEGIPEALEALSHDYTMAVVSSSRRDHFEIIHEHTGLLHHFDFVLTSDEVPETKPSPAPYLKALEISGKSAENCVVIEDSARGLRAAVAAGIACVVIPTEWTGGSDFDSATGILDSSVELTHFMQARRAT
jgi:HAD superfamily hydrolase (TIGR01509 family)